MVNRPSLNSGWLKWYYYLLTWELFTRYICVEVVLYWIRVFFALCTSLLNWLPTNWESVCRFNCCVSVLNGFWVARKCVATLGLNFSENKICIHDLRNTQQMRCDTTYSIERLGLHLWRHSKYLITPTHLTSHCSMNCDWLWYSGCYYASGRSSNIYFMKARAMVIRDAFYHLDID